MLKQRILTALVLLPVVIAAVVYLDKPQFALFVGVIAGLGAWEWANLMKLDGLLHKLVLVLLISLLEGFLYFFPQNWVYAVIPVWWLLALGLVITYPASARLWWPETGPRRGLLLLMGVVTLVPTWLGVVQLREVGFAGIHGWQALLYVLVLIWAADTGAYFAGRALGRHKLAPAVSPGKSVEGLAGGLALSMLITVLVMGQLSLSGMQVWSFALLSLVTILVSVLGDLFESMLKRQRGIKDSSQILPGHGGILDRIDSVTAAAPVFVAGCYWLSL